MAKKNYDLEIIISGGTDASLAASIKKAKSEINKLERSAGLSSKEIEDSFGGISIKGIDALGKASDRVFGAMVKGGKLAAAGVAGILGASAGVGMGFEAQMGTVQAISQASDEDMKKLTVLAKEMGETTQFSAEEAGQGLEYMAMAGWKTEDMLNGLPGVMYLAAASGEELGSVSDIVTDAMTAFGMAAGESGRFADVLAQASASSNTNVGMMGATFQYAAPVAGAFGYTIEDVAIATGLMASAGIKGEKSGTAMRTMLTNLAKPTKQMKGYMDALGISLVDSEGKMKPLRLQMQEMRSAFASLTEAEKAEYAAGIAGKEGMSGLLAIVSASDQDFGKLAEAIDNSTGAAKRMSEVRLDNLRGDLTLLSSAAQGAGIEIYEGFSAPLREVVQDSAELVSSFTGKIREDMPTYQRQTKEFASWVGESVQPVLEFGGWCLKHPDVIKGTLTGIAAAFGTFKGVQAAKDGILLLKTLSGMASAWPVAAFGLAAGAIAGITTAVRENNKRLKKEDMARRFGDIALSMEELDETARMIVGSKNFSKAAEAVNQMDKVKGLAEDFENAGKTLDRLNWKIGAGFALDAGDQEEYASSIEQMVQGALKTVEQSQYTTQISVRALFGEGSAVGDELVNGFDSMYASINGEVQELGKQLGDAYSQALEDGIIDVDEAKTIQELQEKLADITRQVSQAQYNAKLERIAMEYSGKELDPDTFQNLQAEIREAAAEQMASLQQSTEWSLASIDLQAEREGKSEDWVRAQKKSIQDAFDSQQIELDMKSVEWSSNSILSAYDAELQKIIPEMSDALKQAMAASMESGVQGDEQLIDWTSEQLGAWINMQGLGDAARSNIQDLWSAVEPEFEALSEMKQRMEAEGQELPAAFYQSFLEAAQVGAVAGDTDAMYVLLGGMVSDEKYAEVLKRYEESGEKIPEALGVSIVGNAGAAAEAVSQLKDTTMQELNRQFSSLYVNGVVNFNLKPNINAPLSSKAIRSQAPLPAHYASGGLIDRPTLSWFAEEGPEMAIPLDGSSRSIDLWREAGELLGAYKSNNYNAMYADLTAGTVTENHNNSSFAPVYSPVIQVSAGGAVEEQVSAANQAGFDQFVEFMERYQNERYRAAF